MANQLRDQHMSRRSIRYQMLEQLLLEYISQMHLQHNL